MSLKYETRRNLSQIKEENLSQIKEENLSQKDENIVFENKRCDKLLFMI
tara:strand:+ start:757 stop:903 length:147 start_codon:yes stop_codon:yes gene_type:complete